MIEFRIIVPSVLIAYKAVNRGMRAMRAAETGEVVGLDLREIRVEELL